MNDGKRKKKVILKNKMFDLLVEGKKVDMKTSDQKSVVKRFNDVMLCKEFGWTPYDIAMMPIDFYDDTLLILAKKAAAEKRINAE